MLPDIGKIEQSRQGEQVRLDGLKTHQDRNRWGQFSTASPLAVDIARYVRTLWGHRSDRIRFLEPALGTGAFYSAFCQTFTNGLPHIASGIEIDPLFSDAASALWSGTGLSVINADFTVLPPPKPDRLYNLILTNPPYTRHHHIGTKNKLRLKTAVEERLGISISGLAGLYCHFMLLSDQWLADGGLSAWLIPSEFMEVNYGVAVKEYLTERVKLLRIHRFCPQDVQFGDALVTSAVVVFEKAEPDPSHAVEFSFGGSLLAPIKSESVPLAELRATKKWTGYPSTGRLVVQGGAVLGDFFNMKRGVATGSNSFFILERGEAQRKGIPDRFLRPILPSSRHLKDDVIETNGKGYPKLERPLAIIDCDLPEDVIRDSHPEFWAYLETGKVQGVHEGYLASRRTPWYSQEKRAAAPFICTYMGRKKENGNPFRFFWNKSEAIAANVFLLLYPTGDLKKTLKVRPDLYPAVFAYLKRVEGVDLIGEGRVYGGGLHKMEPKELANLPAAELARLVEETPKPTQFPVPSRGLPVAE